MENAMAAKTAVAVKKQPRELSEEEILKAPEKDYMNEAQLAFFRKRLHGHSRPDPPQRRRHGEHLRENEITTDPSDRATLEEEYTLELRTRDRERKLLKKVEKSLRMIEDGSYGYCEENRRADRRAAPHCAADDHALDRGAGAPRARPEAVRRLIRARSRARAYGVRPRADRGCRPRSVTPVDRMKEHDAHVHAAASAVSR
jgi:DnaK suppressor protein